MFTKSLSLPDTRQPRSCRTVYVNLQTDLVLCGKGCISQGINSLYSSPQPKLISNLTARLIQQSKYYYHRTTDQQARELVVNILLSSAVRPHHSLPSHSHSYFFLALEYRDAVDTQHQSPVHMAKGHKLQSPLVKRRTCCSMCSPSYMRTFRIGEKGNPW